MQKEESNLRFKTYLPDTFYYTPDILSGGIQLSFHSFISSSTFTSKFCVKPLLSLGGGTCWEYKLAPAQLLYHILLLTAMENLDLEIQRYLNYFSKICFCL